MKEKIRELVLKTGFDLCGFSDIARFSDVMPGFSPLDVYKDCKSVIAVGVSLPFGLMRVNPRLIYSHYNDSSIHKVDMLTFEIAKLLEEKFLCNAVPMPCDGPYEYWDDGKKEGRGLISTKYAAYCAGLGYIGKSGLLINDRFGSMVTVGTVLTDLEIEPDELSRDRCSKSCKRCMESCPSGAIQDGNVNQTLCRAHAYGKNARGFSVVNCNTCRTVCPRNNKAL